MSTGNIIPSSPATSLSLEEEEEEEALDLAWFTFPDPMEKGGLRSSSVDEPYSMECGTSQSGPERLYYNILQKIQSSVADLHHHILSSSVTGQPSTESITSPSCSSPGPIDPVTTVGKFFPLLSNFEKNQQLHNDKFQVLEEMTFEEKVLMSSATLERNEMYHEMCVKIKKLESRIVQDAITMGHSPVSQAATFLQITEELIQRDPQIRELQTAMLKMRVKRYRLEAAADELGQAFNQEPGASTN